MSIAFRKIVDISLELDPKNFAMRTPAGFKKDMKFEMEVNRVPSVVLRRKRGAVLGKSNQPPEIALFQE